MEQEKDDDWKNIVNLERYHVIREKEILEIKQGEPFKRNICTSDHAIWLGKTWKNQLMKMKVILEIIIHQTMKKIAKEFNRRRRSQ